MDPFLGPIVATWDARTAEQVREALAAYQCPECGGEYSSVSAMLACEQQDLDERPDWR